MDLIDIKIENGRFVFDETGDLVFVKGVERVRQQVEFRLSLWAGEWFLDETFGTPYLLRILGKAAVSVDAAVDALRQQMLDVEGVTSINRLDYTFDAATRKLSVDVDLQSEYGIVKYQSAAQLANPPETIDRTAIDMAATELDSRIIVNTNPPHGVRGAGGLLVMTADGEYPAEMVNNVQVGRQLPVTAANYMWGHTRAYNGTMALSAPDDSPGGGIDGLVLATKAGTTAIPHFMSNVYDTYSSILAGDPVRYEVFLKPYAGMHRRVQVQLFYGTGTTVPIGTVDLDPVDGTFYNMAGEIDGVKSIAYGDWFRFSITYTVSTRAYQHLGRLVMSDDSLTNFNFIAAKDSSDVVMVAQPTVQYDRGVISSVRPDLTRQSPAGSIAVVKMYGAAGVRVILSNGAFYDLDFGDADHVDLPTNPYDVGDAYITRIEYRG